MLNLKKGLALVLAAATAFTFAPVANLGNSVVAQADEPETDEEGFVFAKNKSNTFSRDLTYGDKQISVNTTLTSGQFYLLVKNEKKTDKQSNTTVSGTTVNYDGAKWTKITFDDEANNVHKAVINVQTAGKATYALKYKADAVATNSNQDIVFEIHGWNGTNTLEHVDTVTFTLDKGKATLPTTTVTGDSVLTPLYTSTGDPDGYSIALNETGTLTFETTDNGQPVKNVSYTYSDSTGLLELTADSNSTNKLHIKALATGEDVITFDAVRDNKVVATNTVRIVITAADENIQAVKYFSDEQGKDIKLTRENASVTLDTKVNTSVKLDVTAYGPVTIESKNTNVATTTNDGVITAVAPGTAKVEIKAAKYGEFDSDTWTVIVYVTSDSKDYIIVSEDPVQLDRSSSTASNAVKTTQIDAKSKVGVPLTYAIVSGKSSNTLGDTAIATVNQNTGLVTAGDKVGSVWVRISATSTVTGVKQADDKYIQVVVNALPEAVVDTSDITLDLTTNKAAELPAGFIYSLKGNTSNIVSLANNTLTAKAIGEGKLKVLVAGTKTTRRTEKERKITVLPQPQVKNLVASDLAITSDSKVTLNVGETSAIAAKATSQSAITFTSSDEAVATVSSEGAIEAKAAGSAVITVKAAATDTIAEGTQFVYVTVKAAPVVVKAPKKVTGVKFYYKKGNVAKVSWTKRPTASGYQIKYTVDGKTKKTTRVGNKAAIVIKSGKKVTVQVRAFKLNENGERVYGKWSAKASRTKSL